MYNAGEITAVNFLLKISLFIFIVTIIKNIA